MKATNRASGVTVSADEAVLRRLGPGWVLESADRPKQAPKRRDRHKAPEQSDKK